jgi:uncharacterized membrane protein
VPGWLIRHEGRIAFGLAATYFLVYATLSVLRHLSYHSLGFDLGLYDQVFWNTSQGRILESTMTQGMPTPHSQMSDHFSPIYLALEPFYLAFPHPETLLVLQTLALALGAWPIYLLARLKLSEGYALLWVAVYFLSVPLAYINLFDFHEIAFAVPPLGFALYFLERRRRGWFVLCLLATFLVKEEMPLIAAGFGVYILLAKRDWKLGVAVLLASALVLAAVVQVVIPYFSGGRAYPYFQLRYAQVGGSALGIVRTAVTDPLRIVRALVQPKKIFYVIGIFGPSLGLGWLAGWASLLMIPTLGYLLLSSYEPEFSFTGHYSAPLIPLVLGASIIALTRFRPSVQRGIAAAVVASSLLFSWAYGDLPYSRKFDWTQFSPESRYAAFAPSLNAIPPDASVSAENAFSSQLSERRYIYDYVHEGVSGADWVVLDYKGVGYDMGKFLAQVAAVEAAGYRLVASGYGLALLRRS